MSFDTGLQDYGAKAREQGKKLASLHPFVVDRVARISRGKARLRGIVLVEGKRYAASVDPPDPGAEQFIDASPPDVALPLRKFLAGNFARPDEFRLAQRVAVQVVGRVGKAAEPDGCVPFAGLSIVTATMPDSEREPPAALESTPVPVDPDEELVVLQLSPAIEKVIPGLGATGIVATVLLQCMSGAGRPKGRGKAWTAYVASRPHFRGLTIWVGLSSGVPLKVVSEIQSRFELMGTDVGREMTTPRHDEMTPLLRVDARDVYLLVPEEGTPWWRAAIALSGIVPKQGVPVFE